MAAGELIDSTNSAEIYDETGAELAELVEDVAEHKAPVKGVRRPKCELEVGVELQVGDNQSWIVQESKQTNVKVEPTINEVEIRMSLNLENIEFIGNLNHICSFKFCFKLHFIYFWNKYICALFRF